MTPDARFEHETVGARERYAIVLRTNTGHEWRLPIPVVHGTLAPDFAAARAMYARALIVIDEAEQHFASLSQRRATDERDEGSAR